MVQHYVDMLQTMRQRTMATKLTPEERAKLENELHSLEMQLEELESAKSPASKSERALERIRLNDPTEYMRIMDNRDYRAKSRTASNDVTPSDMDAVARLFTGLKPEDTSGWINRRKQAIAINPSYANIPESYDESVLQSLIAGKKPSVGEIKKALSVKELTDMAAKAFTQVDKTNPRSYDVAMANLAGYAGEENDIYSRLGLPKSSSDLTDLQWERIVAMGRGAGKQYSAIEKSSNFLKDRDKLMSRWSDTNPPEVGTPAFNAKSKEYNDWYNNVRDTYQFDDRDMELYGISKTYDPMANRIMIAGGEDKYNSLIQKQEATALKMKTAEFKLNATMQTIVDKAVNEARKARDNQIKPAQVSLLSALGIHIEEGNVEEGNTDQKSGEDKGITSPARVATMDALARLERGGQATQFSVEASSPQMGMLAHFFHMTYIDDTTWEAIKGICKSTYKWATDQIIKANNKIDTIGKGMIDAAKAGNIKNVDMLKSAQEAFNEIAGGLKYTIPNIPSSLGGINDVTDEYKGKKGKK